VEVDHDLEIKGMSKGIGLIGHVVKAKHGRPLYSFEGDELAEIRTIAQSIGTRPILDTEVLIPTINGVKCGTAPIGARQMSENRGPEREEQRYQSVGEGNPNLGSNRNAEGEGEREVSNRERVGHVVVEAHGVVPEFTKDQHTRKHEQGAFDSKGESGRRSVVKSGATLGRHITSKSGAEVPADRSAKVKSVRVKREKESFGN
jgi:hypothetical protein